MFTPGVVVVFWWVGEKVVLSLSFKDPEGKFLFIYFKIANILPWFETRKALKPSLEIHEAKVKTFNIVPTHYQKAFVNKI